MGSDRAFGLAVAAMLLVIDAIAYWRTRQFGWWLIAAVVALIACALAAPSVLSPLNRAWVGTRNLLSRGTTLVLLAVIYWVAIVPVGLIMRLAGRDRLALGVDKNASTYWSRRSSEGVGPKNKL